MSKTASLSSKIYRRIFFLVFIVLMIEGVSWLGLKTTSILLPETPIIPRTALIYADQSHKLDQLLKSQREGSSHLILDSDLGWRYRENFTSAQHRINQQGLRSDHDYTRVAADGITRIAVFGDSFAFGSEVSNTEAWSTQVERIFPGIELMNYAVPGFGTDQAYLRYLRDGRNLEPEVILIGFAPVNLRRAVNVYRRFISTKELPLVKPRFILDESSELKLLAPPYNQPDDYKRLLETPQLVTELGANDQWYSALVYENPLYDWSATVRLLSNVAIILNRKLFDPNRLLLRNASGERLFNSDSSAFKIQSKILEKFYNAVLETGSAPIIMFFPSRDDISRAQQGKNATYYPLIEFLEKHNLNYIDGLEAFLALPAGTDNNRLFAPGGHYSKEANLVLAEYVGNKISAEKNTVP